MEEGDKEQENESDRMTQKNVSLLQSINKIFDVQSANWVNAEHTGSSTKGIFVVTYFYVTSPETTEYFNLLEAWNWREVSDVPNFHCGPSIKEEDEGVFFQLKHEFGCILKQTNLLCSVTSGFPNSVSLHYMRTPVM